MAMGAGGGVDSMVDWLDSVLLLNSVLAGGVSHAKLLMIFENWWTSGPSTWLFVCGIVVKGVGEVCCDGIGENVVEVWGDGIGENVFEVGVWYVLNSGLADGK